MIIKNACVLNKDFKFQRCNLEIQDGKFSSVSFEDMPDGIDLDGKLIVPGLIDIHTHGSAGAQAEDRDPCAISIMSDYLLKQGTTAFAATFPALSYEHTVEAITNIKQYIANGEKYSRIAGIHMEGPYYSLARKGGQDEAVFRNPDVQEFCDLNQHAGGMIKMISLAPELEGSMDFIQAVSKECVVSIGHTDCDYETAMNAISCGASNITHTFNGMRPYAHRAPGTIGAAFDTNVTCECISDGYHLHPNAVRTLYKMVGADRLVLISDCITSTGLPDGEYVSANKTVYIRNGKSTLADGTIAGGCTPLLGCVRKAIEFGIPAEDAFKCASWNPAKVIKLDSEIGSIDVGKKADFLILDSEYNLVSVFKDGKCVSG